MPAAPACRCQQSWAPPHRVARLRTQQSRTHSATACSQKPDVATHADAAEKYGWVFDGSDAGQGAVRRRQQLVKELPISAIRRPLGKTRENDQAKVEALMISIQEIGLQEPIDVLEVDGKYFGFSGCHRFEAHQKLGLETIKCRVRKATQEVLRMHLA